MKDGGKNIMPAYFSVEFSFKYEVLYPTFVMDIYNLFFKNGFSFMKSYFDNDNLSIDEIIEWNQRHLQNKFRLGYTQHYNKDYKQILLKHNGYEELRLFWTYFEKEIRLTWIVPESDVLDEDGHYFFISSKIAPLLEVSKKIWKSTDVSMIQTCLEFDGGAGSLSKLEKGKIKPSVNPFLITDKKMNHIYPIMLEKENYELGRSGVLLIDGKLIKDSK